MSVDEWDQRAVCPDGACIGVIGSDGLCKVCGRVAPNWGDERTRGLGSGEPAEVDGEAYDDEEAGDDAADDEADAVDEPHDDPDADVSAFEWGQRTLCPDGACLGVIGPDGRCTVCGKAIA